MQRPCCSSDVVQAFCLQGFSEQVSAPQLLSCFLIVIKKDGIRKPQILSASVAKKGSKTSLHLLFVSKNNMFPR